MLIILPGQLKVSGVTTWAMRAVDGLRAREIPAGLVVHCAPDEKPPPFLEPYVIGVVEDMLEMNDLDGCLDQMIPVYLDAINRLQTKAGKPVLVAPNLHGDCYGAIAAIAKDHPHLIRIASWIHSDNNYDIAVCKYFDRMIHSIVPVSQELGMLVAKALPDRAGDITHIPHGVDVESVCPARTPIEGRVLRLLYTGRIEEYQKRISVLALLSAQLRTKGIAHHLRVLGDGPEMDSLRESTHEIDEIELMGSVPPEEVNTHLRWADAWVLPSRFEGQSIAMLEAMAQGCVPIVTRVRSGANDAVIDQQSGLIVDADWDTPVEQIAQDMGDAIAELNDQTLQRLSQGAHHIAHQLHRTDTHVDALLKLIEHVQSLPDRPWPSDQRPAYTGGPGERSASTPHDAEQRMRECLESLSGSSVLIFGAGQHTKDIGSTIEQSTTNIVGIIDDNPALEGTVMFGCQVYLANMMGTLGATDLIISSCIHQDSIWKNRSTIEAQGIRVHRLY